MDKELSNQMEVQSFLEAHNLNKNNAAGIRFKAVVKYPNNSISDTTEVLIQTKSVGSGKIEVIPTDKIDLKVLHTGFEPKWQTFEFDSNTQDLIISGIATPQKGGKPYTVIITPIA